MADRATANLPSRDFAATEAFYKSLGFETRLRTEDWMILRRGALELEFFPHPDMKPQESWFSCSLRIDDAEALHAAWSALPLSRERQAIPRFIGFFRPGDAPRMFAVIDPDGSLLRVIDNVEAGEITTETATGHSASREDDAHEVISA